MYSKAFDGKRNGTTVQRGFSLIQLLSAEIYFVKYQAV